MAVKTLEEVLATLSGSEKTLFENTLKANPELKDGWLRQDDYSRKQTELTAKMVDYDEVKAYNERMQAWADRNVPIYESLQKKGIVNEDGEEQWTAKQAEFERQLAEAKAAAVAGGDMDPAELDRRVQEIVKANGGVTKEELNALVQAEAKKMTSETFDSKYAEKEKSFNQDTIPFVAGFSAAVAVIANKYERESGKDWTADDARRLYKTMEDEKNFDPYAVQEKFLAPVKESKVKADETKAEFDRRVEEEVEKRAPKRNTSGMPGGGDEPYIPQQDKGNVSRMLERTAGDNDFESLIMAGAVKGAKELAIEGKG